MKLKSLRKKNHVDLDQYLDVDVNTALFLVDPPVVPKPKNNPEIPAVPGPRGQPEKPFELASERQQQKLAASLASKHCLEELIKATIAAAKQEGKSELCKVSLKTKLLIYVLCLSCHVPFLNG